MCEFKMQKWRRLLAPIALAEQSLFGNFSNQKFYGSFPYIALIYHTSPLSLD